ncbi:TIGR03364 family FAD-dependent oxidoreductase [Pseudoclavibacter sp. CFCC 13611]|uniref:TIGR03364 family FAD-dependent oxidoreductase n=1 Tax=Pseudoclavibacter sp. CFCC 13611 TaxID=2615178 RepID=UPI001CE4354B|nr:TIGR03364 family FAD-dependent oxidoreductase [Pseudoclavibacter sp. CFCC 13611]
MTPDIFATDSTDFGVIGSGTTTSMRQQPALIDDAGARSLSAADADHFDLVVAGSGIVGLAYAYEGLQRGARVMVIDRAAEICGASVRNFGHACITAQSGIAREYADLARPRWLRLAREAGFAAAESGTVVVARSDEERALLDEFAATRDGEVRLLDAAATNELVPVRPEPTVGGALLPLDLQVDPRTAAPAIARWLASQGVRFLQRTAVTGVAEGVVSTSRGEVHADRIVVAVNHDIDELFPEMAERTGVLRCHLQMIRARPRLRFALQHPLFTGWSMLRYSAFAECEAAAAVRSRLHAEHPVAAELDLNHMHTMSSTGHLYIGDTHLRTVAPQPFQPESGFETLLAFTRDLFGVDDLHVEQRWQGVYASAPEREYLVESPCAGVQVSTVTTGIGMTTALGLAHVTLDL